jgi:hypothetical protein
MKRFSKKGVLQALKHANAQNTQKHTNGQTTHKRTNHTNGQTTQTHKHTNTQTHKHTTHKPDKPPHRLRKSPNYELAPNGARDIRICMHAPHLQKSNCSIHVSVVARRVQRSVAVLPLDVDIDSNSSSRSSRSSSSAAAPANVRRFATGGDVAVGKAEDNIEEYW